MPGPPDVTVTSDVYYDPYDFEIDADPHPVWKRLRDQAPLYYNEKYDFFALSRWDDVEPALVDWETYRSGKGSVLELIRANLEMPPGIILFEDPPVHDVHRGLLSRVFTPKKMNAIEPKVREFCARTLDPLVAVYRNRSSVGDQDSGICAAPSSGFVRRSAVPEVSARCQKMARSFSRSD